MTIDTRDYDLATYYRFKIFFDNVFWENRPNIPITEIRNNHIFQGKRIEFPLVALRRVSTPIMYKDGQNNWATVRTGDRRGRDISISPDLTHTSVDMTMVHSCYELKYVLEVFSFERDNFDELNIELQENLYRYPYLTFENWKNQDYRMPDPQVSGISTNILWESTEDNTDLESFDSQTPFYRCTLTFTLRAYIYRKYAALLLEELLSGYRVLDYKKVTQQFIKDSSLEFGSSIPDPGPEPPEPGPEPPEPVTGTIITTDTIAKFDAVGSVGVFLYIEEGQSKTYGTAIDGQYLIPVGFTTPYSGSFSYTRYTSLHLTGKWRLLSIANKITPTTPCVVFAAKVDEEYTPDDEQQVTNGSTTITTDTIANIDAVGATAMLLYTEVGPAKPTGTIIDSIYLRYSTLSTSNSGELSISSYTEPVTGKWKLLSPSQAITATTPCIVFAVKVENSTDIENNSTNETIDNSTEDNNSTNTEGNSTEEVTNDSMNNDSMNNDSMNNDSMNNDSMNNDSMNNDSMNNDSTESTDIPTGVGTTSSTEVPNDSTNSSIITPPSSVNNPTTTNNLLDFMGGTKQKKQSNLLDSFFNSNSVTQTDFFSL